MVSGDSVQLPMSMLNQAFTDDSTGTTVSQVEPSTVVTIKVSDQNNVDLTDPALVDLRQIPMFNSVEELRLAPATQLEYQFRTSKCFPGFVVSGRFDTYLLMQKRRRPQSAVLHSFIQIKAWGEKLAVDGNEFCVVSVSPDQNCLNYYENF